MTANGATLAGRTLNDLAVNADATVGQNGPNATVTATGALDGQAINAKAEIASAKGATSLPSIEATIGQNTLTGALDLTADFQPNGALTFNFPDLGLLAAMAGQTASGDLAGTASITSDNGVTSVACQSQRVGHHARRSRHQQTRRPTLPSPI